MSRTAPTGVLDPRAFRVELSWHLGAYAARIPMSIGFVGLVSAASGLLAGLSDSRRKLLLIESSTNLAHLTHDPVRVLFASAVWVAPESLLLWAPVMLVVFAALELRIGAKRLAIVFAAGHIGATLLSVFGVWTGIQLGTVAPRVADSVDVGVSYGVASALAFAAILLPARWRLAYASLLVAYFGAGLIEGRTFGDFGHAFALAVGFSLLLGGYGSEVLGQRRRPARLSARTVFSAAAVLTASIVVAGSAGLVERSPLVRKSRPLNQVANEVGSARRASSARAPARALPVARAPSLSL